MNLSLRAKSALALGASILVVLALALLIGWRALASIEETLGAAFTRNYNRYNEQRILAPVMRELALSQRFADSEVTRRWLLDEKDPQKKSLFFAEAAHYQRAFEDRSYFVISATTRHYYFNDRKSRWSGLPRYTLNPSDKNDAWFFTTMRNARHYNINVNVDSKLKVTKVWFNVIVADGARKLGLAGTGLDLTTVLKRFIDSGEAGVTPMIWNEVGAIEAHPNRALINYDTVSAAGAQRSTVFNLLRRDADKTQLRTAMQAARGEEEKPQLLHVVLDGRNQLLALSYVPELKWFVATAVDLKAAHVLDSRLWWPLFAGGAALLVLLLTATTLFVNCVLLRPILRLTASVRQMARGRYDVELPPAGNDELGELTRVFGAMAAQVRTHTDELENKIRERTKEILAVNEQMAIANKNIGDSIRYASLIQNAILPEREMASALGGEYFVWWKPRDVVGGDVYLFRRTERGFLVGVVDCAGHGVPGALMTMIAHGTLNVVLDALGPDDPAAVLSEADARLRATLQTSEEAARLATHMDAGLAYVDLTTATVFFAGAKTSLYWCDGEAVGELKGDRSALGGRRRVLFSNQSAPLDGRAFYLTTDGVLDQSGGALGYSFGNERFAAMLRRHAREPFAAQRAAFERELAEYRDGLPQRDDITVLGFGLQSHKPENKNRSGVAE
jgi:serine phosphatase RsbU (regulator of sigma subunit)